MSDNVKGSQDVLDITYVRFMVKGLVSTVLVGNYLRGSLAYVPIAR